MPFKGHNMSVSSTGRLDLLFWQNNKKANLNSNSEMKNSNLLWLIYATWNGTTVFS
jgi:hypothetical protein